MARVLNLTDVLEMVIDTLDDGSLTQQEFVDVTQQAVAHIRAQCGQEMNAVLDQELFSQRLPCSRSQSGSHTRQNASTEQYKSSIQIYDTSSWGTVGRGKPHHIPLGGISLIQDSRYLLSYVGGCMRVVRMGRMDSMGGAKREG